MLPSACLCTAAWNNTFHKVRGATLVLCPVSGEACERWYLEASLR
jgi:hypothetical protein